MYVSLAERALDLHARASAINGVGETTAQAAPIVAVQGKTRSLLYFMRALSHTQRGTAPNPTFAAFCERSLWRRIDSVGVCGARCDLGLRSQV